MSPRHTRGEQTVGDSAPDGLLVVDKEGGWTSHDVVGRTRRLARTRRVGHAGTLDPMATGVLVLGIGKATKLLTFLVGCDKDYDATIRLGQSTITDDAEGEVVAEASALGLSADEMTGAVAGLTGDIRQVPSAVSAIKVDGRRAYARVRGGETVELPARGVTVSRFEVRGTRRGPQGAPDCVDLDVSLTVSSGTYVRALARDLGAALGVGGHLTALRRTRVGGFTLGQAHGLADLTARRETGDELPILGLADAARAVFPCRSLSPEEALAVSRGQRIPAAVPGRVGPVAALAPDGSLTAMLDETRPTARSLVVFTPASS